MAPAPISVRRQIWMTMKKFKFEELESTVLPHFPEISWSEVRSILIQHHDSFTSKNVVRIIEKRIDEMNIDDKELKERLTMLEVIEISRHSMRKIWYGFQLKNKKDENDLLSLEELRQNMVQLFHTMKLNMTIKLVTNEGITFVSIRDSKSIRIMPLFFALILEQGYFFSSRKSVTKEFLQVITRSSGYNSCKPLKLSGKYLKSLLKILQIKIQGAPHAVKLYNYQEYKEGPPKIKNTGIDFRQHQQRKKYVKQFLSDEKLTLDTLVVKNSQIPWAHKDISSKLPDVRINMEWEFGSHDILGFLLELADKRVLVTPLPTYITKLLEKGKNELTIKNL
ncbi:hypothetical protein PV327_009740 [Microctonus hyperodae]|nr:hypothetical protein PV327_009740 [Microctonus hyperodae]